MGQFEPLVRQDLTASQPIEFTGAADLPQNVWTRVLRTNNVRSHLNIQNKDDVNPIDYQFTINPFAIDFGGAEDVDIDVILGDADYLTAKRGWVWASIRMLATPTADSTIFALGDTDGDEHLRLYIDNADSDKLKAELVDGGVTQWALETDVGIPTIVTDSSKVFFSVKLLMRRLDGGSDATTEPILFVNGGSVPQTFTTSTNKQAWIDDISANVDNARIGSFNADSAGEADQFEGFIDQLAIYRVADIQRATLVARYNMTTGSGTNVVDSSDNGFDGTLSDAAAWDTRSNGLSIAADSGFLWDKAAPRTAIWLRTAAAAHGTVSIMEG